VIQGLRLQAPNTGGLGLISGQGTGSHMPQLNILQVETKTWHSQINKYILKKKKKKNRDFPGGPMVKNLPCSAGDMGSIPDW